METTTVRIDVALQRQLRNLARERKQSMNAIMEQALACYSRRLMFEQANAVWEELKADKVAWAEELKEREVWEGTLLDNLEED